MQDQSTAAAPAAPGLSQHAIKSLSHTQVWARVAGSGLLGVAVLKLIQGGMALVRVHDQMDSGRIDHLRGAGMLFGGALGTLLMVAVYCITGAFALRYAIRLEKVRPPRQPDAGDIALALGAQHRYWRLQGVLTIIGLALFILMLILVVFVIAMHVAR